MTIQIVPRNGGRYKSITTLSWTDIPGLAILSGKNGSGKTQLLEILAYHFSGALPPGMFQGSSLPVEVHVSGISYKPEEISYVPSGGRFSGGSPTSLANMPHIRQQALQYAKNAGSYVNDITNTIRVRRIQSRLGERNPHQIEAKELEKLLPEFDFAIDDVDITAGLTHVFVAHRYKLLEAHERETPGYDENGNALGPSPWEVVNEALAVAGFPYEVISPTETKCPSGIILLSCIAFAA